METRWTPGGCEITPRFARLAIESWVLQAVTIDSEAWWPIYEVRFKMSDFTHDAHRMLWRALKISGGDGYDAMRYTRDNHAQPVWHALIDSILGGFPAYPAKEPPVDEMLAALRGTDEDCIKLCHEYHLYPLKD